MDQHTNNTGTVPGEFLSGVVEGFYGQPWTARERETLLDQMAAWGLTTYMYAPKDDLKHRALWRELYSTEAMEPLSRLIQACRQNGLRFIYGLSPGLDIAYADADETLRIQNRLTQLLEAGCEGFALLFDDIPAQLSAADRAHFDSLAAAQCAVANKVFGWLRRQQPQSRLLFCPTAYCERMARRQWGGPNYLDTIGKELDPAVDVFWTGPEIVSREITPDSIARLQERLGRAPVLWDNLHANDYDLRRLNCGPYAGRPPELRHCVRGILLNPNNEFAANYVPLRTLATYLRCSNAWDPRQAYLEAVSAWLDQFATIGSPVTKEDLVLLGDCYYLPHQEGPEANRLYDLICRLLTLPPERWGADYARFQEISRRIQSLFERLTELRQREIFYAFGRRMWELREEMQLLEAYFQRRQQDPASAGGIFSEDHLPGTYRGGLAARLQRLFWQDHDGRLCPRPPGGLSKESA